MKEDISWQRFDGLNLLSIAMETFLDGRSVAILQTGFVNRHRDYSSAVKARKIY
jgi:hypothetical protein